ncbi:hypothetical protein BIY27_08090 [Gibbsiella quercinecans]|uniref:hypothetical protein n=1 Tax=Gibbsiella quercinecans TaxID=929813 RepID=UPI000EF17AAC|nr:hypothetical protein [Gibbsiella quercinecans]RLM14180.1 hypothetical protein BIY27_08090 [Gibbsiella quercinecans]
MESVIKSMPYLARYAVPRTGENVIPGYYSSELDVWVIDEIEGPIPIILKGKMAETMTKTRVRQEEDDDGHFILLETITKSFANQERDDSDLEMNHLNNIDKQNISNLKDISKMHSHLLELTTKTDVVQERDDSTYEFSHLLELTTKTNYELERDDSSDFDNNDFGYVSTSNFN